MQKLDHIYMPVLNNLSNYLGHFSKKRPYHPPLQSRGALIKRKNNLFISKKLPQLEGVSLTGKFFHKVGSSAAWHLIIKKDRRRKIPSETEEARFPDPLASKIKWVREPGYLTLGTSVQNVGVGDGWSPNRLSRLLKHMRCQNHN